MKNINIYFIRHAESQENAATSKGIGQEPAGPLSKNGEKQSHLLGIRIHNKMDKFDKIFCSTYKRALDTCKIAIGESLFKQVQVVDAIREYNPGAFKGRQISEVYSDPTVVPKIIYQNIHYKFPDGESLTQTERRMANFIENSIIHNKEVLDLAEKQEVNVGVFSHGIAIKTALFYIMGFNTNMLLNVRLDNTSISRVIFNDRGWHIGSLNDTGHLLYGKD